MSTRSMKAILDYQNPDLPIAQRVDDLVSRMTVEEKISQMVHDALPVQRLGIPAYNWWNECLHGVARAGMATVFPQAIGLAATWNRDLVRKVADVISDEARAKHHDAIRRKNHGIYYGLTFWTPNVNIFRDPRWGRGHETYGECPYLTGEIGLQFVKGLQGDDPRYLKLVATPKHFAVHSGPEGLRHGFDAAASRKDMEETYLPAFRKTVVQGKAFSIMGAYNRTNGEACCASPTLLQKILRDTWGFEGYVVSDCGAIDDIYRDHGISKTPEEAATLAVKNGCDLNCGGTYIMLRNAVAQGLIAEAELDVAVKRLFTARFRLGMFDPPKRVPYAAIPMDVVSCDAHRKVALKAARESIVLLRNDKGLLPLDPKKLKNVAVVGPTANQFLCLLGNYHGSPSRGITPLMGIMNKLPKSVKVVFDPGCDIHRMMWDNQRQAVENARTADVIIACMGLTPQFEGEEGCVLDADMSGDRRDIALLKPQEDLLKELATTGKPIVLVLLNGGALAVNWASENVAAILEAWYPGEEGGTAIADVIFGDYNPAGRLPVTVYKSVEQLPDFADYRMEGRTYRYFRGEPLYPFGYGLSYTRFCYSGLKVQTGSSQTGDSVTIAVSVKNAGKRDGDEVVQVYIKPLTSAVRTPIYQLCEFRRVAIDKGRTAKLTFVLPPEAFSVVTEEGKRLVEAGDYEVYVGGCMPGAKGAKALSIKVHLEGGTVVLPSAF